jgi:hypothetical protein
MKKIKFILSLVLITIIANQLHSQAVDKFTGRFSYSTPLMNVPSPYGPGISINAGYGAGVSVNQNASELGLSWELSSGGAITRSVLGVPDDLDGTIIADPEKNGFASQGGLLFFNNDAVRDHMDFYTSTYKIGDPHAFYFPGYDNYSVSGPGIGGTLKPHLFDFTTTEIDIEQTDVSGNVLTPIPYQVDTIHGGFNKTPQFIFSGDFAGDFKSRHYPSTPINSGTDVIYPGYNDVISDSEHSSSRIPYTGIGNVGFDQTTNRLASSKYVTYSTNSDGISGFKITDADGYVYDYSIPVYINSVTTGNYPLNNDYSLRTYDTTRVTDGTTHDYYIKENSLSTISGTTTIPYFVEWKQNAKYAYKWLLKSITGPDYIDLGTSGVVDAADKGYWVVYDYQKWADNFITRIPEYGLNYSFDPEIKTQDLDIADANKVNGKFGTFKKYDKEIYYLNKIITSSHTAVMVRDVRLDECGNEPSHTSVKPQLKITRILLFKNEDFATLNTPATSSSYNVSTSVSGFSLTGTNKDKFYNETWYNHSSNKSSIESKALQTVEFNQDYSLARKYHKNIKTSVSGTNKLTSPTAVQSAVSVSGGDLATSGKLTLNEITTYGIGHVKVGPSVLFNYNESVSTDNPDYNPIKTDYWGFYKSDASSKGYSSYTSSTSKDYTDAWSLRKITATMGGTIEMNYESNQYQKVLNGDGTTRGPSKMYMIKSITKPSSYTDYGTKWTYEMEEDVTTPVDFTELKTGISGTVKHVNIPFISNTYDDKFISHGTFSFTGTADVSSIQNVYAAYPISSDVYSIDNYLAADDNDPNMKYTGNGYIHFQLPVDTAVYGGGIRIKNITVKNGATDTYVQEYTYKEGVTPMEADRFAEEKQSSVATGSYYFKLRPAEYDLHRMGPGIGYTKVIEKNLGQSNTANGNTTYTFITSDAGIDNYKVYKELRAIHGEHPEGPVVCTDESIKDSIHIIEIVNKFSGYWGQLKEQQTADKNGNIVSKTKCEYTTSNQGSLVENFDFVKKVRNWSGAGDDYGSCTQFNHTICIEREFPLQLSKSTEYTQGINTVTEYFATDKITGIPTQIRTTNSNKGTTITKTLPAFRISAYSNMGPKSVNSTNKNILTPSAYTKLTVDSTITNNSDFISYSVNTFKKDFNVRTYDATNSKFINDPQTGLYWVPNKGYTWIGTPGSIDSYGLFKNSELVSDPFDYSLTSIDSKWKVGTENTLMDNSGHILEKRGFNDRFAASKYGFGDTLKIAAANNVNYASFTYCGFESKVTDLDPGAGVAAYVEGEVNMNGGVKLSTATGVSPHTGKYMVKVSPSTTGPAYATKYISTDVNAGLQKGRTYRASVWVHTSSPSDCRLSISLTGATTQYIAKSDSKNITIDNWVLMSVEMTVPSSGLTTGDELKAFLSPGASGDAYFDDLRLQPVEASVAATVYDARTNQIMATLDGNNFATVYQYDAAGRVIEVWQEIEGKGLKKVKENEYNFSRP